MPHRQPGILSKRAIVLGCGLLVAAIIWVVFALLVEEVPDDAVTRGRMRVTQRRILNYYSTTGKLPRSLTDLPPDSVAVDNSTTDGWGKNISYRVVGDQVFLESMGRGGKPGGAGQDQDIILVFNPAHSEMSESFSTTLPVKKAESEAAE